MLHIIVMASNDSGAKVTLQKLVPNDVQMTHIVALMRHAHYDIDRYTWSEARQSGYVAGCRLCRCPISPVFPSWEAADAWGDSHRCEGQG